MLVQRHNLSILNEAGSPDTSSIPDQKTRTVSTNRISPGGHSLINANSKLDLQDCTSRLFFWGTISVAIGAACYRTEKAQIHIWRRGECWEECWEKRDCWGTAACLVFQRKRRPTSAPSSPPSSPFFSWHPSQRFPQAL